MKRLTVVILAAMSLALAPAAGALTMKKDAGHVCAINAAQHALTLCPTPVHPKLFRVTPSTIVTFTIDGHTVVERGLLALSSMRRNDVVVIDYVTAPVGNLSVSISDNTPQLGAQPL